MKMNFQLLTTLLAFAKEIVVEDFHGHKNLKAERSFRALCDDLISPEDFCFGISAEVEHSELALHFKNDCCDGFNNGVFTPDGWLTLKDMDGVRQKLKLVMQGIPSPMEVFTNNHDLPNTYVAVGWPASQKVMDHPDFEKCFLIDDEAGIERFGPSAYMVPEDIYRQVFGGKESLVKEKHQ